MKQNVMLLTEVKEMQREPFVIFLTTLVNSLCYDFELHSSGYLSFQCYKDPTHVGNNRRALKSIKKNVLNSRTPQHNGKSAQNI
jgi:hypothetical protein